MLTDLDKWEREQRAANRFAADMAMWRLSQRYGWGIQHPTARTITRAHNKIETDMRRFFQSFAAWFLPRYDALGRIFGG